MRIDRMLFANFPPFAPGGIVFPEVPDRSGAEVHLLVGENGTGKTRLLSLLLNALGNTAEFAARVDDLKSLTTLVLAVVDGRWGVDNGSQAVVLPGPATEDKWTPGIDELHRFSRMSLPELDEKFLGPFASGFGPLQGYQARTGILNDTGDRDDVDALAFCYKGMASISDAEVFMMKAVPTSEVKADLVFDKGPKESEVIGQLMVNIKLAAAMDMLQGRTDGRNVRLVERLEQTVSLITGKPFSFRVNDHPKTQLRVDWGGVREMRISQLPDGLRSIIGWLVSCCARLSMYLPDAPNPLDHPFVLVLDEPEGNLHPAWQRKVLPAARKLFKNAQIIAATHSPWVVSSVNEGFIHVLRFNNDEQVTVDPPKPCEKGDSYIDVVEDVLGVKEWFDPETEDLLARFRGLVSNGGPAGEIERLAAEIGGRGEYLATLVGREMAGFRRKSQQPKGA